MALSMLRKPKAVDQLRGCCEADLRLCFRICKKPVFSRSGSDYFNMRFRRIVSSVIPLVDLTYM